MATEIAILNFKKEKGKLYHVNSEGNLVEMEPVSKKKTVVAKPGIKKEKGYLYYLNKKGNIAKAKMKNQ